MKLTIESAWLTELDGVPVRAWLAVEGAPPGTIVYVHRIAVPASADASAFDQELAEQSPPLHDPSPAIARGFGMMP